MTCKGCQRRTRKIKQFVKRIKIMGKGKHVTIWDGIQYRQVSEKEAKRLVKKDMAQICPVDGTSMKFRKEFTGYRTREMRAESNPKPPTPRESFESDVTEDWMDYREAAAEELDQPVTETTKKQTQAYMEQLLETDDEG